jgi:hypothetical protein
MITKLLRQMNITSDSSGPAIASKHLNWQENPTPPVVKIFLSCKLFFKARSGLFDLTVSKGGLCSNTL